ncbi:MAG TPA: HEAT repeat domain-containing protein [Candidatus Ozemobacteraceae bacterium]|nr:HEAT repeat domain-containing protein [Candidatus Ozemobacteraceae bacterium]
MDDLSHHLNFLNSDEPEKQLDGLAFFAACDSSMLTGEVINRLVFLAEHAPRHISNVASSIISQSLANRQHNFVAAPLLHKLKTAKENEISLHELEWATRLNTISFKIALEEYLDRCTEEKHISWLVKNLPKAYPDPEQISLLTSFLTYGDDRIVSNTIEGLENIKDPTVVSIFAQMLSHASPRVRSTAAGALARVNPEKAWQALTRMLENPEQTGRVKAACHAIRQLRNRDFAELLIPLLQHNAVCEDAASTLAVLLLEKTRLVFDHRLLKNRPDLKEKVAAAMIENLQKHCQRK